MSYGIEVYNTAGQLQFSQDIGALSVLDSGSTGTTGWNAQGPTYSITTYTKPMPTTIGPEEEAQIWVKPSAAPTGITSTTTRILWRQLENSLFGSHQNNRSWDWKMTGMPANSTELEPLPAHGLEVYDANSDIIFTSRAVLMFPTVYASLLHNDYPPNNTGSPLQLWQGASWASAPWINVWPLHEIGRLGSDTNAAPVHPYGWPDNLPDEDFISGFNTWWYYGYAAEYRLSAGTYQLRLIPTFYYNSLLLGFQAPFIGTTPFQHLAGVLSA